MSDTKRRRRRGERDDGRIQVTYSDGRNPDGTLHRISFYGRSRAEAEAKREEYKKNQAGGLSVSAGVTVNEWVDKWISVYSIDVEMYGPYIERVRADIGKKPLAAIVEADLVLSLGQFSGRSASGATKYRMILQQIFRKARVNRLITWDPAEDLQLPKVAPFVGHRALESWEVNLITENWTEHRCGLWALIMLLAGLRRGELIALDWDSVDLTARTLTVCQTAVIKGNKTVVEDRAKTVAGLRSIPLCKTLFDALAAVPAPLRSGPVCKSVSGSRLTESAFTRGWESFNACLSYIHAGLEPVQRGRRSDLVGAPPSDVSIRPHDLRHTFATLLYTAQVDVKTASYLLGHSDSRVTLEIYTHLSQEAKTRSAAALIGVLDGMNKP